MKLTARINIPHMNQIIFSGNYLKENCDKSHYIIGKSGSKKFKNKDLKVA